MDSNAIAFKAAMTAQANARMAHGLAENRLTADALWQRVAALESENKRLTILLYPERPSNVHDVLDAARFQIQALRTMIANLPIFIAGKEDVHDEIDALAHAFKQLRPMDEAEIADMLEMTDAERAREEAIDIELEGRA